MGSKSFSEDEIAACVQRYEEARAAYVQMSDGVAALVDLLLANENVPFQSIEKRAKDVDSFREKISREGKSYDDPVADMTDLAGVRIITLDKASRDRACKIVEREFRINPDHSADKGAQLKVNEFGYHSVHYVAQFSENRLQLQEYKRFKNLTVEIQIRTVLQHAWSAIDHKLRYKRDADVPSELKRRLYRVSGLLELADDEFQRILVEEKRIAERLRSPQRIRRASLNSISLEAFLEKSAAFRIVLAAFKEAKGILINRDERKYLSSCILLLRRSGIRTIHGAVEMISTYSKVLPAYFDGLRNIIGVDQLRNEDSVVLECVALLHGANSLSSSDLLAAEYKAEFADSLLEYARQFRKDNVDLGSK